MAHGKVKQERPGTAGASRLAHGAARAVQVAPSLMCGDLLHFEEHLRELETLGVDLLHYDVMDSHFAPNLPLGLVLLEKLCSRTACPVDVHLMVEKNDFFVREVARFGVRQVSVHVESATHLDRTLSSIRDLGLRAGVALNPATPIGAIEYVLERLDFVLVMTVNPGFAGQKLAPGAMRKIADCRSFLASRGVEIPIEVDGNVSFENVPKMVAAGADILVAGTSSLYHRDGSLEENAARLRRAIDEGLAARGERRGEERRAP